uniref:SERTA domain-containing protein n=1 Tax=Anolis carolinensis TaxID=28377 RepID=A0A803TX31_ANOCA
MLAKGMKRKWSEDEAPDLLTATPPSSSLFSLSVSKLHQSLQNVEPNLRHLVLVANTLRRIQGEMQPAVSPIIPAALGEGDPLAAVPVPLEPCRKPQAPLAPHVDELLISNMDISVFSSILEDLSGIEGLGDSFQPSLGVPGDLLNGLEGLFEDIDTSMYDSDLWPPTELPHLKEGFSTTAHEKPDLADLDYLMDMLVEVQEL